MGPASERSSRVAVLCDGPKNGDINTVCRVLSEAIEHGQMDRTFFIGGAGIEPRALCVLGKRSIPNAAP